MRGRRLVRVEIDTGLCVGSGMCVSAYPEAFALTRAGKASRVGALPDADAAEEAAEMCPVSAITLAYETDGET